MKRCVMAVVVMLMFLASGALAKGAKVKGVDGEAMVRGVWELMKANDVKELEDLMDDEFQAVHMAGAIDKKDELELLKKLKIKNYKLSDFNVTEEGNVLIVTYKVSADEKIGGKTLSHKPTPRMSIFAKVGGGWKWLAHANLNR